MCGNPIRDGPLPSAVRARLSLHNKTTRTLADRPIIPLNLCPLPRLPGTAMGCVCGNSETPFTDNSTSISDGSSKDLEPASKRRRLATPTLTQETLDLFNCGTESRLLKKHEAGCAPFVQQWANNCGNADELEMPPPTMPSVTPSRGRQRRTPKLTQRQRSVSPIKKANSPQYRAMNMADANVFVDHFPEAPAAIEEQLGRVFGGTTRADSYSRVIQELTRQYCEESRILAKKCAGEHEWRSQLFLGLLQPLSRLQPDVLMLSASEKRESAALTLRGFFQLGAKHLGIAWIPGLKPTAPSPYDSIPPPIPPFGKAAAQPPNPTSTNLATPQTQSTASSLSNTPIISAPPTAPSDTSSANPNDLSTPKPDITLGLEHTSFTPSQRRVLMLLQDECRVLSDPHQAQIGLRFPYFLVECKGGAAGGNLIGAQNQAAVDGACALNILGDLQWIVKEITSLPDYVQYNQEYVTRNQRNQEESPPFLFSVTTEGPIHEIWVHYRVDEAYHMTCHRAWRTTRHEDTKDFVRTLSHIVEWGKNGFRNRILGLVGQIEGPVLGGALRKLDESSADDVRE